MNYFIKVSKIIVVAAVLWVNEASLARDYFKTPFDPNSPWNIPVPQVNMNSGKWSKLEIFTTVAINSTSWSIPFYQASSADPKIPIFAENTGKVIRVPMPQEAKAARGADAHLAVLDSDGKRLYEFYKYNNRDKAKVVKIVDITGNGMANRPGQNIGTRAYGGSSIGGLLRKWELESDVPIQHALAVAINAHKLKRGYIWPATSEDAFSPKRYRGDVPMGSRIALHPDFRIEQHLMDKTAIKIAQALQNYGAYVVDSGGRGSSMILYSEPTTNQRLLQSAIIDLKKIVDYLIIEK